MRSCGGLVVSVPASRPPLLGSNLTLNSLSMLATIMETPLSEPPMTPATGWLRPPGSGQSWPESLPKKRNIKKGWKEKTWKWWPRGKLAVTVRILKKKQEEQNWRLYFTVQCTVCLPELGGRIHVAAFTSASVSCLLRQRCIFRIRVFRVFCTSNAMHSVDPMGEDTRVLKKTRTRKTQMTRTRKTRCRCKFLHISKFKALATKKRTDPLTVFTHSPMHTSISGTHAELWQNGFASGAGRRTNANTFTSAQLWCLAVSGKSRNDPYN